MNVQRLGILGVLTIVASVTVLRADEPAVVLENGDFSCRLGSTGRILGFIDRRTGKDYCAQPGVRPCLTVTKGGVCYEPTACRYDGSKLSLNFGPAGVEIVVNVACKGRYLVLDIASVSDPQVEQVELSNLSVTCAKYVAAMAGVAADDEFAVCLRALNLQVQGEIGGRPAVLRARCYRQYGLTGAKLALVACPTRELRDVLKQVVRAEQLPHSALGGPWALEAEENRSSYLFATPSEQDVEQWIAAAKQANLGYIHVIGWETTLGHYEPRRELYPRGLDGLKAVVDKIHAAGLKAGLHTLTGCISPSDPWVTPVPDRRLDADADFALAAALDQQATAVPTREPPGSFDTVFGYGSRGNVIRIDDELIMFQDLSRQPPYGFGGCTRGAFGTRPAPHAQDAAIRHLVMRWGQFHPDENSTLVDDVAEAIARVYNGCGFDMIYMDGVTEDTMSGGWHAAAKMRAAIFNRLHQPALVEASCWDYHSWPFHSRLGAWDHPTWALKRFVDVHCRLDVLDVDGRTTERFPQASLLPSQLGWWVILGPDRDHRGETPDEMEYLCAKALGHDAPVSFQGVSVGGVPANARQDEYLTMFARYERLRLARYFPESIKARLREERSDYHLVQAADGAWDFLPADYAAHKVTGTDDGSQRWECANRFGAQPLKLRIEALYSVEPYEAPGSLVLADFTRDNEFSARAAAPQVAHTLTPSRECVQAGPVSGRYQAKNQGSSPTGAWAKVEKTFSPEVDLSQHDALGVWIHGDGRGELLNLQLTNPPQYWEAWDEHYVKIDFQGWRYFALPLRERDAEQYGNYGWPYGGHYAVYRSALVRPHTSALSLYFNNLPSQTEVACYLSPIKALKTVKVKLANPSVEIAAQRIVFPVTLESGAYLEFDDDGYRHYDERGSLLGQGRPLGSVPHLSHGANRLCFACEGPAGLAARAEITLISYGDPLSP